MLIGMVGVIGPPGIIPGICCMAVMGMVALISDAWRISFAMPDMRLTPR